MPIDSKWKLARNTAAHRAVVRRGGSRDDPDRDVGAHGRDHDDQGGGRQDPTDPPCVEVGDRRATRPTPLPEEDPGDDEPRDDEEHVDTDVPATDPGDPGVEEDHQYHGHRPEALHIGTETPVTGCRPRFLPRGEHASCVGDRVRHCRPPWLPLRPENTSRQQGDQGDRRSRRRPGHRRGRHRSGTGSGDADSPPPRPTAYDARGIPPWPRPPVDRGRHRWRVGPNPGEWEQEHR